MSSNSTDKSYEFEAHNQQMSLLAGNAMLPVLVTGLFIVYYTFRRGYKLCISKVRSPFSAVDDRRHVVATVVSDPK